MDPHKPLPALTRDCALFLDIDGTLLDFSLSPDRVRIPEGLPALLAALKSRLNGALALLSGRTLPDIERFFGCGLATGAEHGALLRAADGRLISVITPDPALKTLIPLLRAATEARPGTLLETKSFGLALHWRMVPQMGAELTALAEKLAASHSGLMLMPAHEALEIRQRGTDKGAALSQFMALPPFAGRRPIFIGDDVTDEPAIARAREMGGVGLHVGRDFGGRTQAVRTWLATGLEGDDVNAIKA
ncbi:trehalose-phosphatase [Acidocella aminolytica]|jgi:trehalose 6-phosphate phosphatase|uniref:Trehalose 6-phosphate phosphatase n=1 Tax=Acidocella aminolytica 101 = DSM 11237 TaxID=1120923 RepID=A0A0D6PHJ6_9PROT|nr:trehalose-phosphatase [Acidocella aminolytica]GAN80851.1 trehalose phosphatase [Acidocella aminolytica 101 = DSM 11237]GBQ32594.1 trehalose phosphatase [Acidocella aminolytica 101 = DSM 11237]SHE31817.1 trehalose 6-phosphatase [Acidocella aminolytica 101 = DSM 11237]